MRYKLLDHTSFFVALITLVTIDVNSSLHRFFMNFFPLFFFYELFFFGMNNLNYCRFYCRFFAGFLQVFCRFFAGFSLGFPDAAGVWLLISLDTGYILIFYFT